MYLKDVKQIVEERIGKGKLQWKRFPAPLPTDPLRWLVSYKDRPILSIEHNGPRCIPEIRNISGGSLDIEAFFTQNTSFLTLRELYPDWIIFNICNNDFGTMDYKAVIGTQSLWFAIRCDYIFKIDEPTDATKLYEDMFNDEDYPSIRLPHKMEDLESELVKWMLTI